jgi:drug/metabolite transporter (DMT)-like permease
LNRFFKVHLPLLVTNIIYGANFIIAKSVMPSFIQPLGFVLIRVGVALILFLSIHLLFIRERVSKSDYWLLFVCALFGVAFNQSLFFSGIKYTTPIHGSLIMIATPILVLIIERILTKRAISIKKNIGIVLGALGAFILVVFGKNIVGGTNTILGDILILLNATCYAIYLVKVKPLMSKYHPFTVVLWIFAIGFWFVLPLGFGELTTVNWASIPTIGWWAIGSVVIGATFIAYLLNTIALRHANSSVVGIYIYIQPVIAALIGIYTGQEAITIIKVLAAVSIFISVFLVSMPEKQLGKINTW